MHRLLILLFILLLTPVSGTAADKALPLPKEDSSWPILVFAEADSFSARYARFYQAHFGDAALKGLPSWLDVEIAALVPGEHLLARTVPVKGSEKEVLSGLRSLVSLADEIGLTQFASSGEFPGEYYVLGHREETLTLVVYNVWDVADTLVDLDAVEYLAGRGAFLTNEDEGEDLVVIGRGDPAEVDLWHPILAAQVLHSHTIPGNINPTGYLDFFQGSDRDLIMTSHRFQDPITRFRLAKQE